MKSTLQFRCNSAFAPPHETIQVEIQDLRRNYELNSLTLDALNSDPIAEFTQWLHAAQQTPAPSWLEINAMTLATADNDGRVSARIVLLKSVDANGFAFFTNYRSDKANQLSINPNAALVFYWPHVERQVRVEGTVAFTEPETSDQYFHARPRGSQIGAIVSPQSQPLADRSQLEQEAQRLAAEFGEEQTIPRPDYWGGYRLTPKRIEFWQGRPNRLHDRFLYQRDNGGWTITRLAP